MKRTISSMVGKGSVNHNSRKFKAENVDGSRTHLNIDYCNENIKTVYHELFDEALKRYNDKQTRADRKIENYYEKIRNSKQEKPFHELILQIGDKENMSAESENGELARQILDEYYRGFQERNPQLKVFSAHLHMDEATPHLHIDFVPFTTGSKRGLDTRVSLKQALAAQGFKGGTRGDTEWNQWVSAEKSALAFVMERHGIEWEHKGTHAKHLSVLDYKKQEREKEINALEDKLAEKKDEFRVMADRIENFDNGEKSLQKLDESIMNEPEYQLPEPPAMMSARTYMKQHNNHLPIENGVDVISVGTSFLRFLELAVALNLKVDVVTDNDGDISAIEKKYANYIKENKKNNIKICYDEVVDTGTLKISNKPYNYNTLEPKLLKANGNNLVLFNEILGSNFKTIEELQKYMKHHKTETALAVFETDKDVVFPDYIMEAVKDE